MEIQNREPELVSNPLHGEQIQGCLTNRLQGEPELNGFRAKEEGELAIMSTFFYWVEEKSKDVGVLSLKTVLVLFAFYINNTLRMGFSYKDSLLFSLH